jgi:signal transduction histidine kinase
LAAADAVILVHGRSLVPPALLYAGLVAVAGAILVSGVLHPAGEADAVIEVTEDDPSVSVDALRLEASAATADPATRQLLTAAIARFDENRVLHKALESRVAEVRASRRRLVEAGIAERQRLERRLADGAFRYLDELGDVLSILRNDPVLTALATTGLDEIAHTRTDLAQLARGLLPAVLTERGLHNALSDLAAHATVPTVVRAPTVRLPPLVEATVWYACAEAMANVGKYSEASAARIDIGVDADFVTAAVIDDGVGGAVVHPGGGLSGLADRMSAVDGTLTVHSPPGAGTRLTLRVPVR